MAGCPTRWPDWRPADSPGRGLDRAVPGRRGPRPAPTRITSYASPAARTSTRALRRPRRCPGAPAPCRCTAPPPARQVSSRPGARQRLAAFLGVAVAEADPRDPRHPPGRPGPDRPPVCRYVGHGHLRVPVRNPPGPPVLKDVSYGQRFSRGSAGSSGSLVKSLRNATGTAKPASRRWPRAASQVLRAPRVYRVCTSPKSSSRSWRCSRTATPPS
jgi:hypothetical protein